MVFKSNTITAIAGVYFSVTSNFSAVKGLSFKATNAVLLEPVVHSWSSIRVVSNESYATKNEYDVEDRYVGSIQGLTGKEFLIMKEESAKLAKAASVETPSTVTVTWDPAEGFDTYTTEDAEYSELDLVSETKWMSYSNYINEGSRVKLYSKYAKPIDSCTNEVWSKLQDDEAAVVFELTSENGAMLKHKEFKDLFGRTHGKYVGKGTKIIISNYTKDSYLLSCELPAKPHAKKRSSKASSEMLDAESPPVTPVGDSTYKENGMNTANTVAASTLNECSGTVDSWMNHHRDGTQCTDDFVSVTPEIAQECDSTSRDAQAHEMMSGFDSDQFFCVPGKSGGLDDSFEQAVGLVCDGDYENWTRTSHAGSDDGAQTPEIDVCTREHSPKEAASAMLPRDSAEGSFGLFAHGPVSDGAESMDSSAMCDDGDDFLTLLGDGSDLPRGTSTERDAKVIYTPGQEVSQGDSDCMSMFELDSDGSGLGEVDDQFLAACY